MKKIISFFTLLFVIFGLNPVFTSNAASFTQTSDPQNSAEVNEGDVVEAFIRNKVVYDISNIIVDIGNLKDYADDSIQTYFTDNGSVLSYSDKNVKFAKNLEIGGKLTTDRLEIKPGRLMDGVITTADIKNGSLKQEDLDPNLDYGGDTVFVDNGSGVIYYDKGGTGGIGIGTDSPLELLTIENGNLRVKGASSGIIFADGSKIDTKPILKLDDAHLVNDETINGNKKFVDGIRLNTYETGNIYRFQIDPKTKDKKTKRGNIIPYDGDESYYWVSSNSDNAYAEFDSGATRTGLVTLKAVIDEGKYIEIKHGAKGYHGETNEPIKLIPGMKYKTGIWAKTDLTGDSDHGAEVRFLTHDKDGSGAHSYILMPFTKGKTDWTFYETEFTIPENTVQGHLEFRIYGHTGAKTLKGSAWWDINSLYIIPVSNIDSKIKYVNKTIPDIISANDMQKATESVVTEKSVVDYIEKKQEENRKLIGADAECSHATEEYGYYLGQPSELCNIGIPTNIIKDDTKKIYTWDCIGDDGIAVNCQTLTCIPKITKKKTTRKKYINEESSYTSSKLTLNGNNNDDIKIENLFQVNSNDLDGKGRLTLKLNIKANGLSNSEVKIFKNDKEVWRSGNKIGNYEAKEELIIISNVNPGDIIRAGLWVKGSSSGKLEVETILAKDNKSRRREDVIDANTTYDANFCSTDGIDFSLPNKLDDSKNIIKKAGAYEYKDGTYARSCLQYKQSTLDYVPSGIYRINYDGKLLEVYCDMITDGGGWTRFLKYKESIGGKHPDDNVFASTYKIALDPDKLNVKEVLLNGCDDGHETFILSELPNEIKKWIKLEVNRPLSDIATKGRYGYKVYSKTHGKYINFGHDNAAGIDEFETLTFSTHNHKQSSHIRAFSQWGVIDGGEGDEWSSYNNEKGYALGHMNNSDQWVCAYVREIKDKPKLVVSNNGIYQYQDGSVASSCLEYINNSKNVLVSGNYKIKPGSTEITAYCDMVTDGGGYTYYAVDDGIRTYKSTDNNTCKTLGMDIIIPRTKPHFKTIIDKYGKDYLSTVPGISKPSDGGSYVNVPMNSFSAPDRKALDGGKWWLRDTKYSEPNGDYKANGWLNIYDWNIDGLRFNDNYDRLTGGQRYSTKKYICSTNDKGFFRYDVFENPNTITIYGATKSGEGYSFDGNDYIEINNTNLFIGKEMTFSIYANQTTTNNGSYFAKNDKSGGNELIFGIWNRRLHFRIRNWSIDKTWNDINRETMWTFTIKEKDSTHTNVKIYRNGKLYYSGIANENAFDGFTEGRKWLIGQEYDGNTKTDFFHGEFRNATIWNRELSPQEIKDLFDEKQIKLY